MRLFQIAGLVAVAAHIPRLLMAAVGRFRERGEGVFGKINEALVIQVSGGGEYHPGRRIMLAYIAEQRVRRHRPDQIGGAEHRAAQGLIGKRGFLKIIEDHVVGGIKGLVDFLNNNILLAGQLGAVHDRMLQNVGDDIDGQRHILFHDFGVVRGRFPRRVGVEVAADVFDFLGDGLGVAALGALERHMLQEMRDAVDVGVLVPRADLDPGAQRHGLDLVHRIGNDAQAVGEIGDGDGRAAQRHRHAGCV